MPIITAGRETDVDRVMNAPVLSPRVAKQEVVVETQSIGLYGY